MPILQGNLQCRFNRLRTAATVENLTEASAKLPQNELSELLKRIRSKQIPVRARKLLQLCGDGCVDFPIRMTDAECGRSTRTIEIATATAIKQIAALATNDAGQL